MKNIMLLLFVIGIISIFAEIGKHSTPEPVSRYEIINNNYDVMEKYLRPIIDSLKNVNRKLDSVGITNLTKENQDRYFFNSDMCLVLINVERKVLE